MTTPSLNVYSTDKDKSNISLCTKLYRRIVPRTKTNKNKAVNIMFIAELFRGHGKTMFNEGRLNLTNYYRTKIGREQSYK